MTSQEINSSVSGQMAPFCYADAPARASVIMQLKTLLGERLITAQAVRDQHGQGEDSYGCKAPDAVVMVRSTEEVAQVLALCHQYAMPVIPYGAGSSVEGHLMALEGGISLDLSEMNQVLEIHAEDLDCRVQAGVTREALNQALRYDGIFFPIDPGANASIGGMVSTRASGTNAVRYGTMLENVIGLTVVTPEGRIIKTGGRARKSSAGYDLTHLYTGSEGTLGVITEIQLRLHPIPDTIKAATCQFDDLQSAVDTVISVMQCAIPIARIELLNELQMKACISYSKLEGFEPKTTLFFEFHGTVASVAEQVELVEELAASMGGSAFSWAESTEARNALWKARHQAYFAGLSLQPGASVLTTDVCVPVSRLAEAVLFAEQEAVASGLSCPIVGHVGDGNFHVLILQDENDAEQQARGKALSKAIVAKALELEGTCTGEHGIGYGKKGYLLEEHGEAVDLMRSLKRALDPKGIMNPGKIFDL
ncbi:FAD-binding oxidoreductase [Oceanospirillum linum]|nr:FAD-linked oxidase C-terminal domain-containing protein [Oceanospirillum linum]SEF47938.1 D-lactate dehydrogenase (cytochrome) [Oleiphilus messinensis]SMP02633.1 D-lactate dehydrogenase (cytochrome) [Oceanospirillum linum]